MLDSEISLFWERLGTSKVNFYVGGKEMKSLNELKKQLINFDKERIALKRSYLQSLKTASIEAIEDNIQRLDAKEFQIEVLKKTIEIKKENKYNEFYLQELKNALWESSKNNDS
jgi:hypothetical protein